MIVQRRGKNVALVGAVVQLLLSATMLAIWLATGARSAMACAWFTASGVPMWLMSAMLLYCRQIERREAMEAEQIAAGGTSTTIFQRQDQDLHPAANRAAFVLRWIAPIFTVAMAAILALIAVAMIRGLAGRTGQAMDHPAAGVVFALLASFVGFLFSRYSVGMSERPEWRVLRATGSFLTANVLGMAGVVASLACVYIVVNSSTGASPALLAVDVVVAYAIEVIQIVLAVELLLNFVLDIYRPRVPGQEERLGFDSRLCNLIAQPGQVGHSMAEAINYQFGFEVSKSWFYKLVVRALAPLLVFGALVLIALSSVVIVENGEKYVVLHWGQYKDTVGPGPHLKWPWPIDTAQRYQADPQRVQTLMLGVGLPRSMEDRRREGAIVEKPGAYFVRELYLWKEDHGPVEESDFVVAVPPRGPAAATPGDEGGVAQPPPINLIKLVVNVEYVVNDLKEFIQFSDGTKMLECIASREMVNYCASATLDKPVGESEKGRAEAIMTYGRAKAGDALRDRIQAAAKKIGLGVTIRFVGIQAIHPPKQVVPDDEKVLEAERRQAVLRYEAQAEANKMLAEVAGDAASASRLALAIRKVEELESLRDQLAAGNSPAAKMDELLRSLNDGIGKIEREIAQERLMGRLNVEMPRAATAPAETLPVADTTVAPSAGQLTVQQRMLQRLLDYRQLLLTLQALSTRPGEMSKALDQSVAECGAEADGLLVSALGKPATIVAEATADRWSRELSERASSESFQRHLQAYRATPNVYVLDRWLDVWDEVLPRITKYILCADRDKVELRLNWEMPRGLMSGIYDTQPPGKTNK